MGGRSESCGWADLRRRRRSVAADAARLCAQRADEQQIAAVVAAAHAYPDSLDLAAVAAADLEFWTAVIEGAGNLAYRLALNTLVAAITEVGAETIAGLNAAEVTDRPAHVDLAEAIAARDAEGAGRQAAGLLTRFVDACAPRTEKE